MNFNQIYNFSLAEMVVYKIISLQNIFLQEFKIRI